MSQALGVGRFQVDGDAVGKLHAALNLGALGAGHDLQMDVALEAVFFAQDGSGIQELVLRAQPAAQDAGAEEDALGHPSLVESHIGAGELIRREGRPAEIPAAAERAVVAVALARRGEQGFEQGDLLAIWQGCLVEEGLLTFFNPAGQPLSSAGSSSI